MGEDPYSVEPLLKVNNEEELAVLSLLMFGGDDSDSLNYLEDALNREGCSDDDIPLFVDLEWAKQCGNQAFANKNWLSALGYYAKVLKHARRLKSEVNQLPINKAETLLVAVYSNIAQTLLNMGRNDEVMEICQEALKMPILYSKPALHKKVLHRLSLSTKKPPKEAQLAAE